MARKCKICGCGTVGRRWYCEFHRGELNRLRRAAYDRGKPNASERGYGTAHNRLRKEWAVKVDAGGVNCARCGVWIQPGSPWDLGHDDLDRSVYVGPEHRACNRATSGRRVRRVFSREW